MILVLILAGFSQSLWGAESSARAEKAKDATEYAGDQKLETVSVPVAHDLDPSGKVKLGAAVNASYIDFTLAGPAAGATKRYRPWNEYIDLLFYANPLAELQGQAVFRLQNVFGGYWGERNSYAVRRLFIKGDYMVKFYLGDYNAKLTPLTLMTSEDGSELDARFFKEKKQKNRDELYLLPDGTWPLTGYQIGYYQDLDVKKHMGIGIKSFGARLGTQGTATDYFAFAHDQYLAAVAGDLDLTKEFHAGIALITQFDVQETGDQQAAVFRNKISDVNGQLYLWPDRVAIQGEWATSQSNTDTGRTDYFSDQAVQLGVLTELEYFKLDAKLFQVGGDYFAPGAQTRIQDAGINLPVITGNNTWDSSSNAFSSPSIQPHYDPAYPLNKYNNRILASQRLGFSPYENNLFPYGPATPNRNGYQVALRLDFLKPYIQPVLKYATACEIKDATEDGKRNFVLKEAGSRFSWEFITGTIGYQNEDTRNGNHIAMTTTTIRGGLEFKFLSSLELALGYKHQDFNGSEFIGNVFQPYMDRIIDQYGAGVTYHWSNRVEMVLGYQMSKVMDLFNDLGSMSAHEVDASVKMFF
jgi:hypothetical protein